MPIQVCILHHIEDKKYLKKLKNSLKGFERNKTIEIWDTDQIELGTNTVITIKEKMHSFGVILLLFSPDFLAEKYDYVEQSINLSKEKNKVTIPILLRPCSWEIPEIKKFLYSPLPRTRKPITIDKEKKDIDQIFEEIAEDLLEIFQKEKVASKEDVAIPQDTIFIKSKVHDMYKNFFEAKKTCAQRIFALSYPSSLSFLESITSINYIKTLKTANILMETEEGWQIEPTLLESLRKDFEIGEEELSKVEKISTNLFLTKGYQNQDLFNIVHLMLLHYKQPSRPESLENEIMNAFLQIKFSRFNNDPKSVSGLLKDFKENFLKDFKENFLRDFKEIFAKFPELKNNEKEKLIIAMNKLAAQNNIASGLQVLGQFKEALTYLEENLETCIELVEDNHDEDGMLDLLHDIFIKIHERRGAIFFEMGNFKKSINAYEIAIGICVEYKGKNDIYIAALYQNQAKAHFRSGVEGQTEAKRLFDDALRICEDQVNKTERVKMLELVIKANKAVINEEIGKYEEAEKDLRDIIAEKKLLLEENHHSLALDYHNLGNVLQKIGKFKQAHQETEKASRIRIDKLGIDHPYTLATQYNLIVIYKNLEMYGEMERLAEQVKRVSANNNNIKIYYLALDNLGYLSLQKGDFNQAAVFFEQAHKAREEFGLEESFTKSIDAVNIGRLNYAQEEYEKAMECFNESIKYYKVYKQEHDEGLVHRYFLLGKTFIKKEDYLSAEKYFDEARVIREKNQNKHPETAQLYMKIAQIHRLTKKYDKAIEFDGKALEIYKYHNDIRNLSRTLAYLSDAYIQNEQTHQAEFEKYLTQISSIEDKEAQEIGIDVLKKLKSFENTSINEKLPKELKSIKKVVIFLKKLGVKVDKPKKRKRPIYR